MILCGLNALNMAALVELRLRLDWHMGGVLFEHRHVGHFRAVGECILCSPVLNFFLKKTVICQFLLMIYVFLCFQNLRIKNYSEGDWVSEEDLAKGINTKCYKKLENVRSDFGCFCSIIFTQLMLVDEIFDGICCYFQKCWKTRTRGITGRQWRRN